MARPAATFVKLVRIAFDIAESSRPGARVVRGRLMEIAASGVPTHVLSAVWNAEPLDQPETWPIAA
jgi:hypothetical protein